MLHYVCRMNKIISSEGLSSKYLMNNSMPYNGGLDYTAFQIVTYEIFQALGLECEFVPCCEDVELLQAYANKKVDLKQALLMTLYKENMQNKNLNGGVGGLLEYHSKKKNNACILKVCYVFYGGGNEKKNNKNDKIVFLN